MSHIQNVIDYLKPPGRTLTTFQAFTKWKCTRLARVIYEINAKKKYPPIVAKMVTNKDGVRYAKYRME